MPQHRSWQNTNDRYGALSKALHWITALGIIAMIPLGKIANEAAYDTAEALAQKAWLFQIHKTLGVALFFLALIRIGWMLSQHKPAPLHPERRLETFLAELVHWLLYGALALVPLSGWIHHAASAGFAPILWPFGQGLPFVPVDLTVSEAFGALHGLSVKLLVGSLVLHIAGAVKHAVIDKDDTLARMVPGKTVTPLAEAPHPDSRLALVATALIWVAAGGLSFALENRHGPDAGAAAPAVETVEPVAVTVAPDAQAELWQVQEGTLTLSIRQFGQAVGGAFADWQAQIAFDPEVSEGVMGHVAVDIAIGSLTLGTVTDQALGADYFDAANHPGARFSGDIFAVADGFEARGTLDLRGVTLPLTLPFALEISEGVGTASGKVVLDRRGFGIGDSMTDEGQLGFEVEVGFDLIARQP
ncbi:MAG: cytochrome b/b6 domain-containing protein [Pelagimonas sp.]|jgi:cytochrome b561/polyisoprenoid-binding protein YceI|nr:cytochrome b/b6 domain-containing protein [Pelagimonas sp.]